MATIPTGPRLLSKVAKFVRYPNVHWGDLDKIDREPADVSEPLLSHNRQTLKDMIERKRHEDAIRKHEFDQLRQLRRDTPMAKPDSGEDTTLLGATTDPSGLEDRSLTIRKIDEIEAQMSRQWWKAQNQPSPTVSPPPLPAEPNAGSESFFASTQLISSLIDFDDIPTLLGSSSSAQPSLGDGEPVPIADWPHQPTDNKGFDASKLFAAEMADNLSDPDLEEAAVRFANGDEAGAETVLLTALHAQTVLSSVAQAHAEALFELYRSLGQQAGFEREARHYAQQFGCSAPVWVPHADTPGDPQSDAAPVWVWRCPARLEAPALAQLTGHLAPERGLSLDWSGLQQITEPAARELAALLAAWSEQEGALYFAGEQVLDDVLRAATPRGVRQTAPCWWTLRMDLLRILQWQDAFDMAAFEYCLTYEKAPDPWRAARCELLQLPPAAPLTGPVRVTLAGALQGDADQGLAPLKEVSQAARMVTISCNHLIRVDFAAAGSILNWVTRGQAQGCQIEFRDVPPLVASFFNLIGINQHAQVITRTH